MTPATVAAPTIAGVWRDLEQPANASRISQEGSAFTFTRSGVLSNGTRFDATGSGHVVGNRVTSRYTARYFGTRLETSTGACEGSVSADASRIELSCSDTLLRSFTSVAVRE
jgi:hypothetical protein